MDYFDLHCDTAYECYVKNTNLHSDRLAVNCDSARYFRKWVQTFAFWIMDDAQNPWQLYKDMYADFASKLGDIPANLTPLFSVEGGALLENDLDRLYALKADKIRLLTLTWNGENPIAGGSKSDKGLTDFGKEVITEMNRLKIGCDLSHLNEKSFYSAADLSDYPLATHSNCRIFCENKRNLSDGQIRLIAQKGGIIGLCFYPEFLGRGDVYEALYENICRLCDMGICDNIAIGSDFDGAVMDAKLQFTRQVPLFYAFLEKKGMENTLLQKIFYENAHNFIAKLD